MENKPGPKVVIIILNWNGLEDTLDCLESLQSIDYPNYEILLIDNASTDSSLQIIPEKYPDIKILALNQNFGFVGGNNKGLTYVKERSDAEYYLLLNNDTVVASDFLTKLVNAIESDENIGVVGPLTLYYDLPDRIWSAGGEIDRKHWETRMIMIGEKAIDLPNKSTHEVDFVTGCCLLIQRSVVDEIGLLDERFFAYYEDVEWCYRASRAGNLISLVPESKIWHKVSPEKRAASPLVHYYMTRNRLLFMKLAGSNVLGFVQVIFLEYLRTILSWTIRPKWKNKKPIRHVMVRAMIDAAVGRWGKAYDLP